MMEPTTARAALVARLRDALPAGYRVLNGLPPIDFIAPDEHVVLVWTADAVPADGVASVDIVTLRAWVLTGQTDPDRVEDDIELALYTVREAARTMGSAIAFTRAERATLDESWHGYRLDFAAAHNITYTEE